MSLGVFVLVLFVAFLHVIWNAILKTSGDSLRTAGRAMVVGVLVFVPIVLVLWFDQGQPAFPPAVVPLALISGLLEAAYFISLSSAYKRGDLSEVYPIARGTAPILSVAIGVVILGERLPPLGWLGVLALLAGILLVLRPWSALDMLRRRGDGGGRSGAGAAEFALLTGVMISAYSAVDRTAVQSVSPWLYASLVFPVCAIGLVAWIKLVADRRRSAAVPAAAAGHEVDDIESPPAGAPASWLRAGAAGTISLAAYGLILVAYTLAPLTVVAPLRESSVVLASAWGAITMHEAVSSTDVARRVSGAGFVLAGAILLAIAG
ncbi:MAG TPA: DMT family transporter [Candidatus Binatia bacterium]|nr:DMT family transporter [Candidatus Binatia bacterium]